MTNQPGDRHTVTANISGVSGGSVVVGHTIHDSSVKIYGTPVTAQDLEALRSQLATMREAIVADPETPDVAAEKLDELESAVTSPAPSLSTMEYVRDWFGNHAPKFSESLKRLLTGPLVLKFVEAGGETIAKEFLRRFVGV